MQGKRLFQYVFMIAVSFCCGVLSYRYITLDQSEAIIQIFDARILTLDKEWMLTVLPVVISAGIVLLFSTHPYFYSVAVLFITTKAVFFGFSSVYILEEWDRMDLYIQWWFPFQLGYLAWLILLYKAGRVTKMRRRLQRKKLIPVVLLMLLGFVYLETVVMGIVIK